MSIDANLNLISIDTNYKLVFIDTNLELAYNAVFKMLITPTKKYKFL